MAEIARIGHWWTLSYCAVGFLLSSSLAWTSSSNSGKSSDIASTQQLLSWPTIFGPPTSLCNTNMLPYNISIPHMSFSHARSCISIHSLP
ncbi:hypothetical protein BKA93DRAFT_808587 [Sparassis latifolia]